MSFFTGEVLYTYPSQDNRKNNTSSARAAGEGNGALFGGDGLGFGDVLDAINPLQHIPILSSFYREATGDTLSAASRIVGGTLLGGPIGFILSAASAGLEAATGGDAGAHLLAMIEGDGGTQVADAAAKYGTAYKLG